MRLRRSVLAVPGSNMKMMQKASESTADEVFLDIEDAVAPSQKEAARPNIVKALKEFTWGDKVRVVRINDLRTKWAYRDLIEVVEQAGDRIDVIMIPKVNSPQEVFMVDRLLTQIEEYKGFSRRIGLEAQIETAAGLACVEEIGQASPRLETLVWGPGDYAASAGMRMLSIGAHKLTYPGHVWHYIMARIVGAAKAAGLQAIDGPYAAIEDLEGFRESALLASMLGYDGKWAIHPSQVDPCNEIFSPTREELEHAERIVREYTTATEESGLGAIAMNGEMVDAATLKMAELVVAKAKACGLRKK